MPTQESTPRSCAPLSLSMRPISTPVNILVTGGSYVGKSTLIKHCCSALGPLGGSKNNFSTTSSSGVVVLGTKTPLLSPSQNTEAASAAHSSPNSAELAIAQVTWPEAVTLKPVPVPEARREVVYTFQETPGHGSTVDPASHLQSMLMYVLSQREKDYKLLAGSRGLHKSLACGCLENSVSLCIYLLPPHGPSKLDLVMMSYLSRFVGLLPVIAKADCMTEREVAGCQVALEEMLKEPEVPGLAAIKAYTSRSGTQQHTGQLINIWPLPLSLRAEVGDTTHQAALSTIIHMLSSDEVYNLLDFAWDRYTSFCPAYEYAGKRLEAMLGTTCQQIGNLLGGPAKLAALKLHNEQLLRQEIKKSRDMDSVICQLVANENALLDQLAEEQQLLEELWLVFKSFRKAMGHAKRDSNTAFRATYGVSIVSGTKISEELKARFSDMNW